MNDKTLKIRIKLHSTGTPVESLSADPDVNNQKATTPPISETGNSKSLLWLGGSIGLTVLLVFSVYIFNGNESVNPEKSASTSDHKPVEIVIETSSELPIHKPVMNDDSVALGPQQSDDHSSTEKTSNSADIESDLQKKQAKANSLDLSSEKTSANAETVSMSSEASIKATRPSTTPSRYSSLESAPRNQDTAQDSLSEEIPTATISPEDNESTPAARKDIVNESNVVALSEIRDKSTQIESTDSPSSLSHVARAQFTSGIEGREPIDQVEKIFHSEGKNIKRIYYFTEIRDMKGDSIVHRWDHQGSTVANITFNINGDRWRVYSSKNLPSSKKGRWKVVVTDSSGKSLASESFIYD